MRLSNRSLDAQAQALASLIAGAELRLLAGKRLIVKFVMPAGEVKNGVISWPEMREYATKGGEVTAWHIAADTVLLSGEPQELGIEDEIPSDALVRIKDMTYQVQRG